MRIAQILFSQGFGNRRQCMGLLHSGSVSVAGRVVDDADADFDTADLQFSVAGKRWDFHAQALILLHKPAGYECSRAPRHHPGVLSLLPPPLQRRGVQPVGRLDEDTTGLLLLTDDGALIHRLTHPRHHVLKVYEVGTVHPVSDAQVAALLAGVVLHDDPAPARAAACMRTAASALRLSIEEGRYHQVKRMVAAVGNRVHSLHRSAFGALSLAADLPAGHWRWVSAQDRQALACRSRLDAAMTPVGSPAQPLDGGEQVHDD